MKSVTFSPNRMHEGGISFFLPNDTFLLKCKIINLAEK